ncbi:TATA box binding protein associated factor-domain-containing protein [Schizophyllum amplum]|uniref:TATA box binding protein associated factor-domain-containing protein n=1 Tax=Schizophyllum amplum TaxID=97359 RepID=A0A550C6Y9_9AGAR|nr:TATA box binding protein associated factor-domain-containing protein [Auriculariopsis ampla]
MNGKPKTRGSQGQTTGIYKLESIKDVAESLNITNLSDLVATALANDVEYRLHQVVEEAARFMRHGRRTTLTVSDMDQAFKVLNIEPLYGHSQHNPPVFRRAVPYTNNANVGPVYFVEDEEIDFDRVLREEKIALPKGVTWTAHWLAVEGVQPQIPENPPVIVKEGDVPAPLNAKTNGVVVTPAGGVKKLQQTAIQGQQQQQLVKQVLSRELQLYYTRLTASLTNNSFSGPDELKRRSAAIGSLSQDAGLQALLPYLIRWVSESVVAVLKDGGQAEQDGHTLETMLDVIGALMRNTTLFIEPYLHQLLPPLLSLLLHSTLPSPNAVVLRTKSAQTLAELLRKHSTTYPSLAPRIMKTLLLALISPEKSTHIGTREGAVRGLVGVGKEAVRKGLVEGGGARVIGNEVSSGLPGGDGLATVVMEALAIMKPSDKRDDEMDTMESLREDGELVDQLTSKLGDHFARRVLAEGDRGWARSLLEGEGQ